MHAILELPVELWLHIFDYACSDDGTTARSLGCVSSYIREVSRFHRHYSVVIRNWNQLLAFEHLYSAAPEEQRNIRNLYIYLPEMYGAAYPKESWFQDEESDLDSSYIPSDEEEDSVDGGAQEEHDAAAENGEQEDVEDDVDRLDAEVGKLDLNVVEGGVDGDVARVDLIEEGKEQGVNPTSLELNSLDDERSAGYITAELAGNTGLGEQHYDQESEVEDGTKGKGEVLGERNMVERNAGLEAYARRRGDGHDVEVDPQADAEKASLYDEDTDSDGEYLLEEQVYDRGSDYTPSEILDFIEDSTAVFDRSISNPLPIHGQDLSRLKETPSPLAQLEYKVFSALRRVLELSAHSLVVFTLCWQPSSSIYLEAVVPVLPKLQNLAIYKQAIAQELVAPVRYKLKLERMSPVPRLFPALNQFTFSTPHEHNNFDEKSFQGMLGPPLERITVPEQHLRHVSPIPSTVTTVILMNALHDTAYDYTDEDIIAFQRTNDRTDSAYYRRATKDEWFLGHESYLRKWLLDVELMG
ncbi:hypothetical protein D9611_006078 [Ephemerocybe angulata]|uniref:F-box domain-containing protein n=1 Tax=Ephemerocybe angulata TaxID=980116 RepID=A0A8H5CHQ5_9AGAR|nr:hypothetical protein D9611_006078 [Tulosesus angulatus]